MCRQLHTLPSRNRAHQPMSGQYAGREYTLAELEVPLPELISLLPPPPLPPMSVGAAVATPLLVPALLLTGVCGVCGVSCPLSALPPPCRAEDRVLRRWA